jgi:hypothetical protein
MMLGGGRRQGKKEVIRQEKKEETGFEIIIREVMHVLMCNLLRCTCTTCGTSGDTCSICTTCGCARATCTS